MKKIIFSALVFLAAFTTACGYVLYLRRVSHPVVFCFNSDKTIRPRSYCMMNPFRDKQAENISEDILKKLQNGETGVLLPYLSGRSDNSQNHILEREKEFQIKSWRVGRRDETAAELTILYWVSRENYDWVEEVNFHFVRENGEWKLRAFSAIY